MYPLLSVNFFSIPDLTSLFFAIFLLASIFFLVISLSFLLTLLHLPSHQRDTRDQLGPSDAGRSQIWVAMAKSQLLRCQKGKKKKKATVIYQEPPTAPAPAVWQQPQRAVGSPAERSPAERRAQPCTASCEHRPCCRPCVRATQKILIHVANTLQATEGSCQAVGVRKCDHPHFTDKELAHRAEPNPRL